MWLYIAFAISILITIGTLISCIILLKRKTITLPSLPNDHSMINNFLNEFNQKLESLPGRVLDSITGSISNQKGKLAELIAYLNLKANYDRIIPLGNIVDFIGITFPKEGTPGTFDLIDIKNGRSARLSEDQKQLQKLIQEQKIQFVKVKVTTDAVDALKILSGSHSDV